MYTPLNKTEVKLKLLYSIASEFRCIMSQNYMGQITKDKNYEYNIKDATRRRMEYENMDDFGGVMRVFPKWFKTKWNRGE